MNVKGDVAAVTQGVLPPHWHDDWRAEQNSNSFQGIFTQNQPLNTLSDVTAAFSSRRDHESGGMHAKRAFLRSL